MIGGEGLQPLILAPGGILEESSHDLASRLQQRMTSYDLEEPLQPLSPAFDDLVCEPVGEHLAGEGGC